MMVTLIVAWRLLHIRRLMAKPLKRG